MPSIVISAILQVAVALLIAVIVWWIFGRDKPFTQFVGLKPSKPRAVALGVAIGLVAAIVLLNVPGMAALAGSAGSVAATLRGESAAATTAAIFIVATFKTSFTEELLFRGIIAKWLIRSLGFPLGNLLQAAAFGAAHLLLWLLPGSSAAPIFGLALFATATGWINGWMKERLANGSILPGWAAHATANLLAYSAVAFGWF